MRKPRLLVLTPDFLPEHGGIQLLMERVTSGLSPFYRSVVTVKTPGWRRFDRRLPYPVARVGLPGPGSHRADVVLLNLRSIWQAFRERPDVVLCGEVAVSPAARLISAVLGVPYVLYIYASELSLSPRLSHFAVRGAAATIAISSYTEARVTTLMGHPVNMWIICPGVDGPADPGRDGGGPPAILTIARLADRQKGHDVMMRAMPLILAKVPQAVWWIVGSGPLQAAYEQWAAALNLSEHVRFFGAADADQRDALFRQAAVLVMVSRVGPDGAGEGYGIVYAEAGTYAVPVVGAAQGGTLDAVDHESSGVLLEDPEDHIRLASVVVELLLDRARAQQMGAAGARRASQLSWAAVASQVGDLLQTVAASKQKPRRR